MNVRSQVSMVFHLDKCIGCHTCSVACKNVWTDRPGAEYMWWNNVETKPGVGYPIRWEDQEHYQGGWAVEEKDGSKKLVQRAQTKPDALVKLFYNPNQPGLDDYYEPWTYTHEELFDAPQGEDQPTAIAVSQITGEPMEIKAGPNWDDDLSGSPIYAENDINLDELSEFERDQLLEVENIAMWYLPRICNHCANPTCVASCPSGAIYKRGEDGIVLIDQEKCRGWRACVTACPYKKIYFNWKTGKSEKCILCYPRLETGQAPACFHSCVGRIRYLGVLLYDADGIEEAMKVPDKALVEAQRSLILDPNDPAVIAAARKSGITDAVIESAQHSPVYDYVMKWKVALPLHLEYRTMPMLFYVPTLLPIMGKAENGVYDNTSEGLFGTLDKARTSVKYLARLFSAGNEDIITASLRKLLAVRFYKRSQTVGDIPESEVRRAMHDAGITAEEAEAIYKLTALATNEERFVIPPMHREEAISQTCGDMQICKGSCGLGLSQPPKRGE